MGLKILSSPPPEPEEVAQQLGEAIRKALPGALVEVKTGGAGHFELAVTTSALAGLNRVKQQQTVYAAIAHLMAGDSAPVHAIDRMTIKTA
jgi:acid stress-induced BolA-like protein IbaG/YrbA